MVRYVKIRENVTKVYSDDGKKVYGVMDASTYFSQRKDNHYAKNYEGWGVQLDLYEDLKRLKKDRIVIGRDGYVLIGELWKWEKWGKTATLRKEDGAQRFLPEVHFIRDKYLDPLFRFNY